MDDVADRAADQRDLGHRPDADPGVVLDLGDRAADHVDDRHRVAPAPAGRGAGQDDQVLGVAAHPGGEVVDPEQVLQLRRVVGPALHPVQQGQLAVQQRLAAAGDVEEHLVEPAAHVGLVDRGVDRGALDLVERVADLADLVLAVLQRRAPRAATSTASPRRSRRTTLGSRSPAISSAAWRRPANRLIRLRPIRAVAMMVTMTAISPSRPATPIRPKMVSAAGRLRSTTRSATTSSRPASSPVTLSYDVCQVASVIGTEPVVAGATHDGVFDGAQPAVVGRAEQRVVVRPVERVQRGQRLGEHVPLGADELRGLGDVALRQRAGRERGAEHRILLGQRLAAPGEVDQRQRLGRDRGVGDPDE